MLYVRHAGGAPAQSGRLRRPPLRLDHAGLQAARRDTHLAGYCEGIALADASILTTNNHYPQII